VVSPAVKVRAVITPDKGLPVGNGNGLPEACPAADRIGPGAPTPQYIGRDINRLVEGLAEVWSKVAPPERCRS
jgi:hypothetical protein